jgi:anaerobic magnesium-protoporphyrin IX monomethyl ester cyclase
MKVVLVTSPGSPGSSNNVIPVGILNIAAYLEEKGVNVSVIDAGQNIEPVEDTINRISQLGPDLVGIGGLVTAFDYIHDLSIALKERFPQTPVVLGGQAVVNTTTICFENFPIDYIINGYGEIAIEKLVRHLRGELELNEIPGLTYRVGDDIVENAGREFFKSMDDMPFPAYHLIDMETYLASTNSLKLLRTYFRKNGLPIETVKNVRSVILMGALGCTDVCTFCIHEQEFVGLKYYSNEYVLRHIQFLKDNYNVNFVAIGEEMFITNLKRCREFNSLMKERFPDIYWMASTRADFVTEEVVEELGTGTCVKLSYGFESASQTMLDLIKKRMTAEENIRSYQIAKNSKLVQAATIMVGNVGETYKTIKENIEGMKRAGITSGATFFATPYPGGRLWDWVVERGLIQDVTHYLLKETRNIPSRKLVLNLTPYPDWVVKSWRQMVMCTGRQNQLKGMLSDLSWKSMIEDPRDQLRLLVVFIKTFIRAFFGFNIVPIPLIQFLAWGHFTWVSISRRFYKTKKDIQYEFKTDDTGALLPDNFIAARPQRYQTPGKLEKLKTQQTVISLQESF